VALDAEARAAELGGFAAGGFVVPHLPKPVAKPLDVHVARAAANNLILNVVNLDFEIRRIVVAQGIQFHNADRIKFEPDPDETVIPKSLQLDFPDIVIQDDTHAVFISDVQRVEYRIEVVNTKDAFKDALETPGIHVIYCGHSRLGRGPCFGPDIQSSTDANGALVRDLTGDNWETGEKGKEAQFGIFRMGRPFLGAGFLELDEHQFHFRPVPTDVKVDRNDIDPLSTLGGTTSLPTRFETLSLDPIVDAYHGSRNEHTRDGVLAFAGFSDLLAVDLKCRCLTVLSCDSLRHFHEIVRKRKGFTRTETEGFAYFVQGLYFDMADRLYLGSLFEFNERNDFRPWFPCLEFAASRTSKKLAAARANFSLI
jgi:hypothetical protein